MNLNVLALEPYYGGSHRAFLDGWARRSRHSWTILSLPAHNWKWRMRHGPVALAEQAAERAAAGERWDAIFCSDMLDLAAFLGLAGPAARALPSVAYFHENQLTYPVRFDEPRDRHFAFTNLTTALAATGVWFNSRFHRETFLDGLSEFLGGMPDHRPLQAVQRIRRKSRIIPPGIEAFPPPAARRPGPMRILWAARWEYDKGPATFFQALRLLEARGVDFRLSVIGQQFRRSPEVFAENRSALASRIDRWGYLPTREDYVDALGEADAFVSTAEHEFFGIAAVEAAAAGALPVLPDRLAYPEVLAEITARSPREFLYDGAAEGLAGKLSDVSGQLNSPAFQRGREDLARSTQRRFGWDRLVAPMDDELAKAADLGHGRCG